MAPARPSRPIPGPAGRIRLEAALLAALLAAWATSPARAAVYMNLDQALAVAFADPSAAERKTAYLTTEQAGTIEELAGSRPETKVVVHYRGTSPGGVEVTAYFDTHLVRTLPETVMIVVGPEATVLRVDILSFDEPSDYLPSRRWLDQFNGRPLDEELSTRRAIRSVTGATMSSKAVTATVRRTLAVHRVLYGDEAGSGPEAGAGSPEDRP